MIFKGPLWIIIHKGRGGIYLRAGKYANAYADYSLCVVLDGEDSDAFFDRAMAANKLKNYDEVSANLLRVINLEPDDDQAYHLLAENALTMEDTLKAIQYLDSALKYNRYNRDWYIQKGELLMSLEEYEKAVENFNTARYYTYSSTILFLRGKSYYHLKDYERSRKDLEDYIDVKKMKSEAYYLLAKSLDALGKSKRAQRMYGKAKSLGYKKN